MPTVTPHNRPLKAKDAGMSNPATTVNWSVPDEGVAGPQTSAATVATSPLPPRHLVFRVIPGHHNYQEAFQQARFQLVELSCHRARGFVPDKGPLGCSQITSFSLPPLLDPVSLGGVGGCVALVINSAGTVISGRKGMEITFGI